MTVGLLRTDSDRLPPAPPLPRLAQMAGFVFAGDRFLDWCHGRYGPAVSLRTYFDDGFVMVFDPELVKEVFRGPPEQLHAGEANVMLGPLLGERSVLLLDGSEHLRQRRLMLPSFHGERMRVWTDVIRESADVEIDAWPVGREFRLLDSMQALTLRVIVKAVFGYAGSDADELSRRLRAMIAPLAQPRSLMLTAVASRLRGGSGIPAEFAARRRSVDELLFAEIGRRRDDPRLAERDDVFSALLLARDEDEEKWEPAEKPASGRDHDGHATRNRRGSCVSFGGAEAPPTAVARRCSRPSGPANPDPPSPPAPRRARSCRRCVPAPIRQLRAPEGPLPAPAS